jgi:hypothetical protein
MSEDDEIKAFDFLLDEDHPAVIAARVLLIEAGKEVDKDPAARALAGSDYRHRLFAVMSCAVQVLVRAEHLRNPDIGPALQALPYAMGVMAGQSAGDAETMMKLCEDLPREFLRGVEHGTGTEPEVGVG